MLDNPIPRDERWELILNKLEEVKEYSDAVRRENMTRKEWGGVYKFKSGYSTQVRRPVRDLLKWMDEIESLIFMIMEEVYFEMGERARE